MTNGVASEKLEVQPTETHDCCLILNESEKKKRNVDTKMRECIRSKL